MAIENKPASAYAAPHTEVVAKKGNCLDDLNVSVGGISKGNYKAEKTDGIKIRGTGAATKGLKARGPMA